jgi:hypothetical protein
MWGCVDLASTDVSEESILHLQGRKFRERWTSVGRWLQSATHTGSPLADFSTLKMEATRSSETSFDARSTQCHIPGDDILQTYSFSKTEDEDKMQSLIWESMINCIRCTSFHPGRKIFVYRCYASHSYISYIKQNKGIGMSRNINITLRAKKTCNSWSGCDCPPAAHFELNRAMSKWPQNPKHSAIGLNFQVKQNSHFQARI